MTLGEGQRVPRQRTMNSVASVGHGKAAPCGAIGPLPNWKYHTRKAFGSVSCFTTNSPCKAPKCILKDRENSPAQCGLSSVK